jgi:hypothetical protein
VLADGAYRKQLAVDIRDQDVFAFTLESFQLPNRNLACRA